MVEFVAHLMESSSHRDVLLAAEAEGQQKLLTAAGLAFRIAPPEVDEAAIYEALHNGNAETDSSDVAELLARAKAEEVSARVPAALVIGADQVLSLEGNILDKPTDRDAVRDSLFALRGKTDQAHSAVALAEGGQVIPMPLAQVTETSGSGVCRRSANAWSAAGAPRAAR